MIMFKKIILWPRDVSRRTYRWMVRWAETAQAEAALAGFSFAESSFFPIPPDPLLIAIVIVKPGRWKRLALITALASIAGGILGWFIGYGLFETVGRTIIDTYNLHEGFAALGERYQANALLTVFVAALTPIPYKLITISAGVFHVNIVALIVASIIGRGSRFFAVAWLSHKLGERYQHQIEKYIDIISLVFVLLIILGFVALKYL